MAQRIVAAMLMFLAGSLLAQTVDIQPKIDPGYTPERGKDEQGLWMEVDDYEKAVQRSGLLIEDRNLNEYVWETACRVSGDYCEDLRVYVIRNPGFNASMTANGMIQVWTGLLTRVSSEDELAAILGHELAHYTQLHTLDRLRRLKKAMAAGSIVDFGLLILTGTSIPAGQSIALLNAMAFNREQESEADLLGLRFMESAGYDPHAAYRVWNVVVDEEIKAAAKRQKPGMFSNTHPDSAQRAQTLQLLVIENYGPDPRDELGRRRHVEILEEHYLMLMEDQVDTNRFGRTKAMLERHDRIGVKKGFVDFFYGEMYRQRDEEGDEEMAKRAYISSIQSGSAPPQAYRNLGYMNLKDGDFEQAGYNFNQYLMLNPEATDREMIQFYLEEN